MSRSVNKVQCDILLNRMQGNRSIACGFVKMSKDVVAEFWSSLTDELNSAGPPLKNVTEWKKVWKDQKRYVRTKAATNMKNQPATGGGPNQTKSLSAMEQSIYELVGMKESVEGLDNTFIFGLPECSQDAIVEERIELPVVSEEVTTPPQDPVMKGSSEKKLHSLKRKRVDITPAEKQTTAGLIAQELKVQESVCSKISAIAESLQNHNKEMESGMKRIYRALEKRNELKAKKLKELERHNTIFEELRIKEVESKLEKIKEL